MLVIPRQHAPLGELDKKTREQLFLTAASVSSLLFDRLGLHGTNIIARDGEHSYYQVIGRTENDELELRWTPTRASPQDLETTSKRIAEETWYIGKKEEKGKIEITRPQGPADPAVSEVTLPAEGEESRRARETAKQIQDAVKEGPKEKHNGEEHNYLLRQLTRRR